MKNVRAIPRTLAKAGLAFLLVLLFAQASGRAAVGDPLPYTKGFLVTGDYVVGGVDLTEQANPIDVNGFSTGQIVMSGVPANADIVAAYLFWETLTEVPTDVNGVKFRGTTLDLDDVVIVRRTQFPLANLPNSTCWSSSQNLTVNSFRADVLSLLPMRMDAATSANPNGNPTGKRLVNTSDLLANNLLNHTVTLPVRTGNQPPESAGASLVVVYRTLALTEPLRKVVIYDGFRPQLGVGTPTQQTLQGFYKRAVNATGKLTHILASGQPNNKDRIRFNNTTLATDVIPSGSSSQRAWANPTFNISSTLMDAATYSTQFGDTVTTTVDHSPASGSDDCLSWGAVIFSTAVADVDDDGLPDELEDNSVGLTDPDGRDLPNLKLIGAASTHKDIFVEVNAMWAAAGTSYGSEAHPFSPSEHIRTDSDGHHHMPTPEDLYLVGKAFEDKSIKVHFDVGNRDAYHALGLVPHSDWEDDYTSLAAESYLVPSAYARGGELVKETLCDQALPCQFPAYPGTVRWKFGLQAIRDAPVADDGEQLAPEFDISDWFDGNARVRFDPARRGLFHYLLMAHARAKPKSAEPCLVNGVPGPFDNGPAACNTENPDFHVPSGVSGRAELPGGTLLVTMGLWTEFVGRPFARAGTIFHELGHNLGLNHGGNSTLWGSKVPLNTTPPTPVSSTYFEPNCKPNYLSSMSYLYQVHGLFDANGGIHLDYSGTMHTGTVNGPINEAASLTDGALDPSAIYRPNWFAPVGSQLALQLGASPATRFCNGNKFDPSAPPVPMARVHAATPTGAIDWNGDLLSNTSVTGPLPIPDVNFDGVLTGPPKQLNGFDDWNNIRLDQVGAGTDGYTQELANGTRFGEMAPGTGGEGFEDQADGFEDQADGFEDQADGFEDQADGYEDQADGFEDQADGFEDQADGKQDELSQTHANEMGIGSPYGLTACVIGSDCPGPINNTPESTEEFHRIQVRFTASPTGANSYEVQRTRTDAALNPCSLTTPGPANAAGYETITAPLLTKNVFIDRTELADGFCYTYRVRVNSTEGMSPWSNEASVTALNGAPVAGDAEAYTVVSNQLLTIPAPGLLANDSDSDSPTAYFGRRAVLVSGPTNGTLTLNANGSFTYISSIGFSGVVTFKYKADDGLSVFPDGLPKLANVPLSAPSADITVMITVSAPPSSALFLHGNGSMNTVIPTASTPVFQDSPAVNFNANNPWKDVGTWTAGPKTTTPTTLNAWLGLKNSGDINTAFDLRAEVYQNGTALVAFGESRCITGLNIGANLAKLVSVTLAPGTVNGTLSLKLRARVGTNLDNTRCSGPNASHTNAAGLRVYLDATTLASKLVVSP